MNRYILMLVAFVLLFIIVVICDDKDLNCVLMVIGFPLIMCGFGYTYETMTESEETFFNKYIDIF